MLRKGSYLLPCKLRSGARKCLVLEAYLAASLIQRMDVNGYDQYLGNIGRKEKLLAALCVGGVPEYLKQIKNMPSDILGLYEKSFTKDGFFLIEYQNIFVSSLSNNAHYQIIIRTLAQKKYLSRDELSLAVMNKKRAGCSFTAVIEDLERCGFISGYVPIHLNNGRNLRRYCLSDEYINFYQKFIRLITLDPKQARIF